MDKKTVKLTKFNKIQEKFDLLTVEYEQAKRDNDTVKLNEIKDKYKDLRVLLRSNAVYFNNLENTKNVAKMNEKEVYKENKSYISLVEAAPSFEEYIRRTSKPKVNLVKKHWKKVAVVTSLLGLILLGSCANKNKKNTVEPKVKQESTTVGTIIQEEPTTEDIAVLNDLPDNKTDREVTLNDLPEDITQSIVESKQKVKEDVKNKIQSNIDSKNPSKTSSVKKPTTKVTEKAADPNVDNKTSDTKEKTPVKTEIVPEPEAAKEPKPVDYDTKIIDNTEPIPKEEKVTIIENNEDQLTMDTTNIPVDGETNTVVPSTNPNPNNNDSNIDIPKEEREEIIEVEETTPINIDNIPIEEVNTSENQNTQTIFQTSKDDQVIEETEVIEYVNEETEVNIDNLPVEEDSYTLKLSR